MPSRRGSLLFMVRALCSSHQTPFVHIVLKPSKQRPPRLPYALPSHVLSNIHLCSIHGAVHPGCQRVHRAWLCHESTENTAQLV